MFQQAILFSEVFFVRFSYGLVDFQPFLLPVKKYIIMGESVMPGFICPGLLISARSEKTEDDYY